MGHRWAFVTWYPANRQRGGAPLEKGLRLLLSKGPTTKALVQTRIRAVPLQELLWYWVVLEEQALLQGSAEG